MSNEPSSTKNYDVFLSFRGEDTGFTFTGNLYNALRSKRIKTFFREDEYDLKLHTNDSQIPPSALKAIKESRISIVVFSKNYASSSRCLDELVAILECKKMNNQLVWPIYYEVEPSDVRLQRGSYEKAMYEFEKRFGDSNERVKQWRAALSEVANLAGWVYQIGNKDEYKFIRKIVESAVQSLPRYDVFLSFTGEDTRYTFTGFLYNAFRREGFKIFMDDEELEGGNQISQKLMGAIESSRISIVVFSENYAYSTWCLDELAKIIDCMKTNNQMVWPIFFYVEQSDVCNQTKSYGDAMTAHENRFGKDSEKVQIWRSALSEISNLKGEHVRENEYQHEFIERIVEQVINIEDSKHIASPFLARTTATRKRAIDTATQEEEPKQRYDVFLSFRGEDTRRTFTGNLYAALQKARLRTFIDHGGLKGGDEISHTLIEAMEASRISIVVLSKNYASSTWCLHELVIILECMKTKNQRVLPIFYDVDPSDVRHQRNSFEKAMVQHEDRFRGPSKRVQQWRSALTQVANLSGWHFRSGQYEYKFIEDIVRHVTLIVPRYGIFLSFSGKDTRSFTGFLYNALCRRGYDTFMNDGDQSSQSTIESIESSRLSIIVFSENYARSSSCLDELLTILECMEMKNQLVCPIFYKVLPSDLRHQRNSYGEAMTEHENMLGKDSEKVKKWRSALFEVANLKGFYLKTGYEYEFVDKIVEMASKI